LNDGVLDAEELRDPGLQGFSNRAVAQFAYRSAS
jgi:hypothetical protein